MVPTLLCTTNRPSVEGYFRGMKFQGSCGSYKAGCKKKAYPWIWVLVNIQIIQLFLCIIKSVKEENHMIKIVAKNYVKPECVQAFKDTAKELIEK